eukprot:TRINITY_DN19388_c0_g1_i3.p1 TRINITY_DN19388_c0_g1~~TRINITY_DN19388_c0_g1_i3.p1  ORF type:complete len:269 (-),score=75.80 TRINITY_DN19388_c0_g1_i3:15-821(-)
MNHQHLAASTDLFHRIDIKCDGVLDTEELQVVFGGKSMVMLHRLLSLPDIEDEHVTLDQWLRFLDDVRTQRGDTALDTFINYLNRSCDTADLQRISAEEAAAEELAASPSPAPDTPPRALVEEGADTNPTDEMFWGTPNSTNTHVPPEIMIKILRPDLFEEELDYPALFEREEKQALNEVPPRDYTQTVVLPISAEFDRQVDPRSRINAGYDKDTTAAEYGPYEFEVNRDTGVEPVSYTHLRAHETPEHLVCRLLLEKKKNKVEQKET